MIKNIITFFDRLEDKIRGSLSRNPILYASIVSVGIVLLWRGIWTVADYWNINGYLSILIGAVILLLTGIFVSGFIGNSVLLAGMRKEKKLAEKTMTEVEEEMVNEQKMFHLINASLERIEKDIEVLKAKKTRVKKVTESKIV